MIPLHIVHGKITDTGGEATLSNVVSYLQERDPAADILLPADLSQIRIDDLQLRDAPADLALEALSAASGNQFTSERVHSAIRPGTLYIIRKNGPVGPPLPERTVQALNLTGYLSYMNLDVHTRSLAVQGFDGKTNDRRGELDEVLAKLKDIIIRTIDEQEILLPKRENSRKREITFYGDADLLVVVGTPDELETARKIINALPGETGMPLNHSQPAAPGTKPR
jgi:hypothetical protein